MTTVVRAVYVNGVLRPDRPLPLADGEAVEVTVTRPTEPAPVSGEEAALLRLKAARTFQEWLAANEELAKFETDDGYDVVEEMDKYRRATGQAPLIPRPGDRDYR